MQQLYLFWYKLSQLDEEAAEVCDEDPDIAEPNAPSPENSIGDNVVNRPSSKSKKKKKKKKSGKQEPAGREEADEKEEHVNISKHCVCIYVFVI